MTIDVLVGDCVVDLLDPVECQLLQVVDLDVVHFGGFTEGLPPLTFLDLLGDPQKAQLGSLGAGNTLNGFLFRLHLLNK